MSDGYFRDIPSAPKTSDPRRTLDDGTDAGGFIVPALLFDASPVAGVNPSIPTPATGPLVITVHGTPAPQGSKRHVGNGVMIESSKKVKPWREAVKWAVLNQSDVCHCGSLISEHGPTENHSAVPIWGPPLTGPVHVSVTFRFARPKSHFRTGANSHMLRDNAPVFPSGRPDLDKVLRSTMDALGEAGVFKDDAQVVLIGAGKVYADRHPVGAVISVSDLT